MRCAAAFSQFAEIWRVCASPAELGEKPILRIHLSGSELKRNYVRPSTLSPFRAHLMIDAQKQIETSLAQQFPTLGYVSVNNPEHTRTPRCFLSLSLSLVLIHLCFGTVATSCAVHFPL